jgi:hypothetical protein
MNYYNLWISGAFRILAHIASCRNKYSTFFTNIGQFPIVDGLFERMRLAYFSIPQLSWTLGENPEWEFVEI